MNTQYIRLNMVPAGVLPVMHVSQFDLGRPLGVVVYDGSAEMDLDDYTVTIEATRTDGTPITAPVTTDGNIGAFTTTATMTNKDDLYPAQLVIIDGDSNRVASLPFMMRVVEAAMDENSAAIEEDEPLYQQYNVALQALISNVRANINADINSVISLITSETSARAAADTTLQNNINTEAGTRATTDASLQSQINQLIAPTGTAPSAAEVENARISTDGITYDTLGNAIRNQVGYLKNALGENYTDSTWAVGGINTNTGASNTYNTRLKLTLPLDTDYRYVSAGDPYYVDAGVWVNGAFVGMWNGSTCTIGEWFKHRTLDIKKLLSTMSPSTVMLILQNATNTAITQSDAVQKVFFYKPDWVTKSELNAEVGSINTKINNIVDRITTVDSGAWQQGGINASSGEFQPLTYRIRKRLDRAADSIVPASGYKFGIFGFNGDTYIGMWDGVTFATTATWFTNTVYTSPLRAYSYSYWIVSGKTDDSTILPSEGSSAVVINEDDIQRLSDEIIAIPRSNPNVLFQLRPATDGAVPPESKWYVQSAWENQYDRVRFDIRKTTDGHYVCIHDPTINNVAVNPDGTPISGTVSSDGQTLATLNQYDWGLKYGTVYAGATVPMLENGLNIASAFNLGVTIHFEFSPTAAECEDIAALLAKYGLLNNAIIICINGYNLLTMQKFKTLSPKISFYAGGTPENLTADIADLAALKSEYNKVYLQPYPIGTYADGSLRALAMSRNLDLYCSWIFNTSDFADVGFNHGYTLMEIQGIRNIKAYTVNYAYTLT